MKTIRLLTASGLALLALMGLMLILSWGSAATASAEEAMTVAVAPVALPIPYLSDEDVADAPYSVLSPTVDGMISPGEYAHAGKIAFPGYAGAVEVFVNQDGANLYVALDSPDTTPYPFNSGRGIGPALQIFLDTQNDKAAAPQADDYRLTVQKNGNTMENVGQGTRWSGASGASGWSAAVYTTAWGWQAEFAISFAKLGITQTGPTVIGFAVAEVWTPYRDWYWPDGGMWDDPSAWGKLISSSEWGSFYWKPGLWQDYAPSGVPDFDQRQDKWALPGLPGAWSHCGPVAIANSLWWFDSKFETPDHPPPAISDTYRLVRSYGGWDDHDPQNVMPLVDDLAQNYFGTNQGLMGTNVISMFLGTQQYLRDRGLWDEYLATLVISPSFEWIADEVMRSEDVVLLLGFWQQPEGSEEWVRIGGHFVTVVGADPQGQQLAFSDPAQDMAELSGVGRVLSGTLLSHHPPHPGVPDPGVHNDAGNVSHDVYAVLPASPSPGGTWWIPDYEMPYFILEAIGINPNPSWKGPAGPPVGTERIHTEIEYALALSPFKWKASGEWLGEDAQGLQGTWQEWIDYAPNGVPDFGQKQDCWGIGGTCPTAPPPAKWTLCGPVAAANSLWWFDSVFEPQPQSPSLTPPDGVSPLNDHYPLVQSYQASSWDDHDPQNVDNSLAAAGSVELVEDLSTYLQTGLASGTVVTDLYHGLEQYVTDHGLRQGYVITLVRSPDFWWVAQEVEVSEDVILLLGFWERVGPDDWQRLGGHYVTVPGVDKQGGLVALSDPFFDRIEQTWPLAGGGAVPGWPAYAGRVADGSLLPHGHPAVPPDVAHNDAGNVSHDVYRATGTGSPGGTWGPAEYVTASSSEIENFVGQNGEGQDYGGGEIQTEVDWAVALSPVADVGIAKTVTPTVVEPGDWVTFTLTFSNGGSLLAEEVVITDELPVELEGASWAYWMSNGQPIAARPGTRYVWDVPDVGWKEWGMITITAQVSPALGSAWLTNTARIGTSTVEQYQVPGLPNESLVAVRSEPEIYALHLDPTTASLTGSPGQTMTYTVMVYNDGILTDTYDLTHTVAGWTTTLSGSIAGPVAPGGSASFQVYVTIPGTAAEGAQDVVTVTVSSQGDESLSNSAVLTTRAATQTIAYGVAVAPHAATGYGGPGDTVAYTLRVTNTGDVTDVIGLSHSGPSTWTVSYSANPLSLDADIGADIVVSVSIPLDASPVSSGVVTVTATSQGDAMASDAAVLRTKVSWQLLYLPVILRNLK